MRPYVTCLMMLSIDGKIDGDYIDAAKTIGDYYDDYITEVSTAFGGGSNTHKMYFSDESVDLSNFQGKDVPEGDYVVTDEHPYLVSFDSKGRVYWSDKYQFYPASVQNRVLVVTTKLASKAYLAYLRSKEIPYIICGDNKVDLTLTMEKLYSLFHIERFAITGGAVINAGFIKENLVDELALVVAPYVDGNPHHKAFVEFEQQETLYQYKLKDVKKLPQDGLLITYKR